MGRIRWGILGAASIAKRQAIPAIQASTSGAVTAIASRDIAKADEVAGHFGVPKAYGSYEELIEADDVDVVYIPLPNDLHLPWIEKAARAGKHVLCEKPLGLNAAEVEQVQKIARETGRFIMEGVASRFHPVHDRVEQLVGEGRIGDIRFIRMSLGWSFQGKPGDFRWQKTQGGGGLLDLGCYCVGTARMIAAAEPTSIVASATFDPETGVDTNMGIMLTFAPQGTVALIDCGILSASRNYYEVIGTSGKISVTTPFGNGSQTRNLTLYDRTGTVQMEEAPTAHQMQVEFETVSQCIAAGRPAPVPISESLANARVLDACLASARSGGLSVTL